MKHLKDMPEYQWLHFMGRVVRFVGFAVFCFSIISAIIVPAQMALDTDQEILPPYVVALGFLGLAFLACIYAALGEFLIAFRDLVRNSWRLRTLDSE